ncbi:hypothetical protein AJ79_04780 [Helicocarpus griseus UAMH5409]|uniref:Uncharacterized protein n=1 Tax=Helicocarpus griseus UAMH5409 TaxID=1447875 RepID=A0A2B7XRN7_9EURO|nr:hypothetical protein AJ79_04780 [Helicocarpus griseus UAMH5409]
MAEKSRDKGIVHGLLEELADLEVHYRGGWTFSDCAVGNESELQLCLRKGTDIEAKSDGLTPLDEAAILGYRDPILKGDSTYTMAHCNNILANSNTSKCSASGRSVFRRKP